MSEAYDTQLVTAGNTTYERFATAVVAASFLTIILAALALSPWLSVSGTIGSLGVARLLGVGLFALGLATGTLGILSRFSDFDTAPSQSPGVVVGVAQALVWFLVAGFVATYTLGLGWIVVSPTIPGIAYTVGIPVGLGWLAAIPVGLLAGFLTLRTREDIGVTVPTGGLLCVIGAVLLVGVISPEWAWRPESIRTEGSSAIIPGSVVIPVLALGSGFFAGWAGASAHEGFGARGRQNGAFLLISSVVLLVLSILGFLITFIFQRGLAGLVEHLAFDAGTGLVLVGTLLVMLVRYGTLRPALASGTTKVAAFLQFGVSLVLGLCIAGLLYAVMGGHSLSGYSISIEPTATVGAMPGLVVGVLLLLVARRSGTRRTLDSSRPRAVDRGLGVGMGLLTAMALLEVYLGSELLLGGTPIVPVFALTVGLCGVGLLGAGVADTRVERVSVPEWVPPLSRSITVVLVAFVVACIHLAAMGTNLQFGPVGIVSTGTLDWPFLMNPSEGLYIDQRGVMPAMLGTVWIVLGAIVFAVPLAVGAAVFLTEYASDSVFTRAVDVATNGLWSTPSIVFGLFGLAFIIPRFGDGPSIFAAQLVLGFMLLPLVLITSREAMKSVPDEYRDASAALGVSKWDTIRSVVIPAAMPGITTGVILGVGRIAGETAPLLLVLNGPVFPTSGPGVLSSFTVSVGTQPPFVQVSNPALLERASALPYQLYTIITAGVGADSSFGWATALVLLLVVLGFFAMGVATRRFFRRKLHQ